MMGALMAEGCCNGRNHLGHLMILHNAVPEDTLRPTAQQMKHIAKKMKAPPAELFEYIPQLFHTDFGEQEDSGWFPSGVGCAWSPDEVPCTAMLALSHVKLDFALGSWEPSEAEHFMQNYPDAIVTCLGLEPGDIIIWRGDLFHRGPACESENLRILSHVYGEHMNMVEDKLFNVFQNDD